MSTGTINPTFEHVLDDRLVVGSQRYLFMMTHNRSYSTLLCHILGSHPRISGYTECKIAYETVEAFTTLHAKVAEHGNYRDDCQYLVDKMVYDHFTISDAILADDRVTLLVVIREPEPSITSWARMILREHNEGLVDWGILGAHPPLANQWTAELYTRRLSTLRDFEARVASAGARGIFLTSDSLMDNTQAAFRLIERTLGLDEPLREDYELFPKTGVRGSGDTSPAISSGRVVRERSQANQPQIVIPRFQLDHARQAYASCLATYRASSAFVQIDD